MSKSILNYLQGSTSGGGMSSSANEQYVDNSGGMVSGLSSVQNQVMSNFCWIQVVSSDCSL